MTKYVYKVDYNNSLFLNNMKKYVGNNITQSECTSDGLMVIDANSNVKDDLDEYMNQQGFSYLFETTKTLSNPHNWGILATADLPSSDVSVGDSVYNSTTKKPLWWDGTAWKDALGN
jgi:hypothetical protein